MLAYQGPVPEHYIDESAAPSAYVWHAMTSFFSAHMSSNHAAEFLYNISRCKLMKKSHVSYINVILTYPPIDVHHCRPTDLPPPTDFFTALPGYGAGLSSTYMWCICCIKSVHHFILIPAFVVMPPQALAIPTASERPPLPQYVTMHAYLIKWSRIHGSSSYDLSPIMTQPLEPLPYPRLKLVRRCWLK